MVQGPRWARLSSGPVTVLSYTRYRKLGLLAPGLVARTSVHRSEIEGPQATAANVEVMGEGAWQSDGGGGRHRDCTATYSTAALAFLCPVAVVEGFALLPRGSSSTQLCDAPAAECVPGAKL